MQYVDYFEGCRSRGDTFIEDIRVNFKSYMCVCGDSLVEMRRIEGPQISLFWLTLSSLTLIWHGYSD